MLNRSEAVLVLQDILINFAGRYPNSFGLSKTDFDDTCDGGYRIYIRGCFDDACKQKIQQIATDYQLSVKEENGLVIYTPTS